MSRWTDIYSTLRLYLLHYYCMVHMFMFVYARISSVFLSSCDVLPDLLKYRTGAGARKLQINEETRGYAGSC